MIRVRSKPESAGPGGSRYRSNGAGNCRDSTTCPVSLSQSACTPQKTAPALRLAASNRTTPTDSFPGS
eukprot:665244-Hanusia_phi.AAC.1